MSSMYLIAQAGAATVGQQIPVKSAVPAQSETSTQDAPAQDAPAQDAPAQDAPAQDAPAQDAPAQDAPAQDAPAQDAPAQEVPTKSEHNTSTSLKHDEPPPPSEGSGLMWGGLIALLLLFVVIGNKLRAKPTSKGTSKDVSEAPPQPSQPAPAPITAHALELRMLVESTYIKPLKALKESPEQALNDDQIEAIFKRPNIHMLHAREQLGELGERSFTYENGESLFDHVAQLYLCVNISFKCDEASYQEVLNTKSLAVLKRRLRGAAFTLRELRYERLNDTDRVLSGQDER